MSQWQITDGSNIGSLSKFQKQQDNNKICIFLNQVNLVV